MKILILLLLSLDLMANEHPIDIKVENFHRRETLAIKITTTPEKESEAIQSNLPLIYQYILSKGVTPLGPPYTRYFKYSSEEVIIEVGFPINGLVTGSGKIMKSFLPSTMAVTTLHIGPYSEVSYHYEAIKKWLKDNDKESNGAPWEISLNFKMPGANPSPLGEAL